MRRILGIVASLLLLAVVVAPWAASDPVDDAEAIGAGWTVTVGGVAQATLVPEAHACFPATAGCPEQETNELLGGSAIGTTVSATALISEAEAHQEADATASLQGEMDGATPVALPATWNARGYSSLENFSALNGQILADSLEVETVSGTRTVGGASVDAVASGVRIVNLRLAGLLVGETLAPIVPGQVNQELFDQAGIRIVYWETNWDPADLTTTDGQPIFVNALHITAPGGIDIVVSQAQTESEFTPPPVNNPPAAQNDAATTNQGTPVAVNVIANDSDPDGNLNTASVTVTTPPSNGNVVCNGAGSCTYTPAPGFTGTDTFTYQVCDTNGACDTATVTITVNAPPPPANVPPTAVDDVAATNEETAVQITVATNDSDPDGTLDLTSVTVTVQPIAGIAVCNNSGICTYTPDAGFAGTDTFTYLICDDDGACDSAVVTIDVAGAPPAGGNPPPVAVDDNDTTNEDTPVTIDVDVNDTDDGAIDPDSVSAVTQPANGVAVCSNGSCTYTPDPGFAGNDQFDYQICDNLGACATATVTIDVAGAAPVGANQPPNANNDTATTDEGAAVSVNVAGNDTDPEGDLDLTSVAVTQQPTNGAAFCNNSGSCTYTPGPGFSGVDTFEYLICDTSSACDTATVTVTVNPLPPANDPPLPQDDTDSTNENTPVAIDVVANDNDPDGNLDQSSVQIVDHPDNGAVICDNGGICTYTPNAGFTGTDTFEYLICDTNIACASATVTVTVAGPPAAGGNAPPVAQNDSVATNAGSPATVAVTPNDSDPDGTLQPSSVTVTQPAQNGAVICSNGSCTYTPALGFSGTDSFEYRVCDNQNACDTAVVDVTVNPVAGAPAGPGNSPPVAQNDNASTGAATPVTIVVVDNDGDPEGNLDPTSVTVIQPPQNGAVVCSGGSCTYTPAPGFTGTDDFEYRVCDTVGSCTTATVTIDIPVVSPPPGGGGGNGGGGGDGGGGNGDGGGGNNGGGGGNGGGTPDRAENPSTPGDAGPVAPAPDPISPVSQPVLGGPGSDLPFTGNDTGLYVNVAVALLLLGTLALLAERLETRRRAALACPAWHAHAEVHGRVGCPYGEWR